MKQKLITFLTAILFFFLLSASISDSEISTYEDEELKWEDGAYGHFVMFKSNIYEEPNTGLDSAVIGCVDEETGTTFTLDSTHIPSDAFIERAFLVWTGAIPIENFNDPTDNEVTLKYNSTDAEITLEETVTATKAYKTTESANFEFAGFKDLDNPNHSYSTYRVDVTGFFKKIHKAGRDLTLEDDGYSLYGNYNVYGLTCASDSSYINASQMVSDWSIILIYTSEELSPKKIFIYDEFVQRWHDQTEMYITGFEFPTDPKVKITIATHEGDPNLFRIENPYGNEIFLEGIQIRGEWVDWLFLSNDCNPEVEKTEEDQSFIYSETFNTISSIYGWADEEPTCIGGTPPVWDYETIERGIDVDTFVLDSYKDGSVANHFHKGGEFIELKIGANQDQYITNYMIVETDTKAPMFDIPGRAELVACTPANKDDKWCENGEHTFAIRIQNWGDDIAPPVTVKASIPVGMEYIPGSTEYSTDFISIDNEMIATNWHRIPDLEDGELPLEEGFQVAETIDFCDRDDDYPSCFNLIMVRFRTRVKADVTKSTVIEASASIETSGYPDYKTNLGIPSKLRLEPSECVTSDDEIDLSKCGGTVSCCGCMSDADCGEFQCCDLNSGVCIDPPCGPIATCNEKYEIEKRELYPLDDIVFIEPDENIVLGRFSIQTSEFSDCAYEFSNVKINFNKDDPNIGDQLLFLVQDLNLNGIADNNEPIIAHPFNKKDGYTELVVENYFWGDHQNHFLIVGNMSYIDDITIPGDASFTPSIEVDGITIDDTGSGEVTGLPITFNKFQLIPDDAVSIIRGENDPTFKDEPLVSDDVEILQFKAISKGNADKIKKIKVQIPEEKMATFGEKISRIALYLDTDNDGKKDELIAEKTIEETTDKVELDVNIELEQNNYQYYILSTDIELEKYDYFSLEIYEVETENGNSVFGIPIISNQYGEPYDPCDEEDQGIGIDSESGCGCSII